MFAARSVRNWSSLSTPSAITWNVDNWSSAVSDGNHAGDRTVGHDLIDERLVQLDRVEVAPCEHGQVGSADQRHVVQRDLGAHVSPCIDGLHAERVGYPAFRDFQHHLRREIAQAGFRRRIGQPAASEDLGRSVDADVGVGMRLEPAPEFGPDPLDHPVRDEPGQRRAIGRRYRTRAAARRRRSAATGSALPRRCSGRRRARWWGDTRGRTRPGAGRLEFQRGRS